MQPSLHAVFGAAWHAASSTALTDRSMVLSSSFDLMPVIDTFNRHTAPLLTRFPLGLQSGDVERLYTNIPHADLIRRLTILIRRFFAAAASTGPGSPGHKGRALKIFHTPGKSTTWLPDLPASWGGQKVRSLHLPGR